jgi:hypothetical protein
MARSLLIRPVSCASTLFDCCTSLRQTHCKPAAMPMLPRLSITNDILSINIRRIYISFEHAGDQPKVGLQRFSQAMPFDESKSPGVPTGTFTLSVGKKLVRDTSAKQRQIAANASMPGISGRRS